MSASTSTSKQATVAAATTGLHSLILRRLQSNQDRLAITTGGSQYGLCPSACASSNSIRTKLAAAKRVRNTLGWIFSSSASGLRRAAAANAPTISKDRNTRKNVL